MNFNKRYAITAITGEYEESSKSILLVLSTNDRAEKYLLKLKEIVAYFLKMNEKVCELWHEIEKNRPRQPIPNLPKKPTKEYASQLEQALDFENLKPWREECDRIQKEFEPTLKEYRKELDAFLTAQQKQIDDFVDKYKKENKIPHRDLYFHFQDLLEKLPSIEIEECFEVKE